MVVVVVVAAVVAVVAATVVVVVGTYIGQHIIIVQYILKERKQNKRIFEGETVSTHYLIQPSPAIGYRCHQSHAYLAARGAVPCGAS